jgi:low molecular weight protein-tyrosine phosphatase
MSTSVSRLIRSVLISPPIMFCKRQMRDAVWAVRGRRLCNPPWPSCSTSVIFVCLGNICRSPFAALLTATLLEEAGLADIRCSSAGLNTFEGARSPKDAIDAAHEFGVSLEAHRPVPLTQQLVSAHDIVVVMEPWQADTVSRRWPAIRARLFLLPLFEIDSRLGAFERCHLIDPFGKDETAFRQCYARIDVAVRNLVDVWRRERGA